MWLCKHVIKPWSCQHSRPAFTGVCHPMTLLFEWVCPIYITRTICKHAFNLAMEQRAWSSCYFVTWAQQTQMLVHVLLCHLLTISHAEFIQETKIHLHFLFIFEIEQRVEILPYWKQVYHTEARTKWPTFSRWQFQMNCLRRQCSNFE